MLQQCTKLCDERILSILRRPNLSLFTHSNFSSNVLTFLARDTLFYSGYFYFFLNFFLLIKRNIRIFQVKTYVCFYSSKTCSICGLQVSAYQSVHFVLNLYFHDLCFCCSKCQLHISPGDQFALQYHQISHFSRYQLMLSEDANQIRLLCKSDYDQMKINHVLQSEGMFYINI